MDGRSCSPGQSNISQKTFNLQNINLHPFTCEKRVQVPDARNLAGNKNPAQLETQQRNSMQSPSFQRKISLNSNQDSSVLQTGGDFEGWAHGNITNRLTHNSKPQQTSLPHYMALTQPWQIHLSRFRLIKISLWQQFY